MKAFGIYTLANDVVFDQLVASIEANIGCDIPVCIIPFDNNLGRVKQEITLHPYVTLFEDESLIDPWEKFARQLAKALISNKISSFWFYLKGRTAITLGFLRNLFDKAGYFIFWISLTLIQKRYKPSNCIPVGMEENCIVSL
ncbi:MAG: hypothetical protein AAF757_18970 [Cyanobacteria bacterium P01_D01_bin.116]